MHAHDDGCRVPQHHKQLVQHRHGPPDVRGRDVHDVGGHSRTREPWGMGYGAGVGVRAYGLRCGSGCVRVRMCVCVCACVAGWKGGGAGQGRGTAHRRTHVYLSRV